MFGTPGEWIVARDMTEYERTFREVVGAKELTSGSQAKLQLVRVYCSYPAVLSDFGHLTISPFALI